MARKTLVERLQAKLIPGEHGCLIWVGHTNPRGIPMIWAYGRNMRAQRVAWELANGRVRRGGVVRACPRDPRCVNVEHLAVVTKRQAARDVFPNVRENLTKSRCPAGHPLSGGNVYRWRGQRHCRACHRERERDRYRARKRAAA